MRARGADLTTSFPIRVFLLATSICRQSVSRRMGEGKETSSALPVILAPLPQPEF